MSTASEELLNRLYRGLNEHHHQAMADCYHEAAAFRDIAFALEGRLQIHAMWHMICETDISATFEVVSAGSETGRVALIDDYTFKTPGRPGRPVHNVIDSQFKFRDGLIIEQHDFCDSRKWAAMALGGLPGFLAGRIHWLRSYKAGQMLKSFVVNHPEYLP